MPRCMMGHMTSQEIERKPQRSAADIRRDERKKQSNIDRIILRNARKSYEEIHDATGVPVDEIAVRLDNLLTTRDHLTERQEERLLIIEMGDLIDDMKLRMEGAKEENYADIANVTLRGYEAIAKRLDARRKLTEVDIAEITRSQGQMFLAIMLEAIQRVTNRMEELHPDIEFDIGSEIEEAFAIALPEAREEVNKRVRD